MQREIVGLIQAMTKKRDELDAAISALSRVRLAEREPIQKAAPEPKRKQRRPKWTHERLVKFRASMAARRQQKANGSIPVEGATPIPDVPVV